MLKIFERRLCEFYFVGTIHLFASKSANRIVDYFVLIRHDFLLQNLRRPSIDFENTLNYNNIMRFAHLSNQSMPFNASAANRLQRVL